MLHTLKKLEKKLHSNLKSIIIKQTNRIVCSLHIHLQRPAMSHGSNSRKTVGTSQWLEWGDFRLSWLFYLSHWHTICRPINILEISISDSWDCGSSSLWYFWFWYGSTWRKADLKGIAPEGLKGVNLEELSNAGLAYASKYRDQLVG